MAKGDKYYYKALKLASEENYNAREIILLLEKSISFNNKKAAYALATWYFNGYNVRKNHKRGFQLLKIAIDGNYEKGFSLYKDALYDMAICYELGHGTRKNLRKAVLYYALSAYYGDEDAWLELLRCLHYGIGINQDTFLSSQIERAIIDNKHVNP